MKKILTLIGVSALGGILTLGAYKLMEPDKKQDYNSFQSTKQSFIVPTKSINSKTALINSNAPDLVKAANGTIDAVVHVKNKAITSGPRNFYDLLYGRESEQTRIGTGSGVIISPDGYIITNNHVIAGASELSITMNNNKVYAAKLIGTDKKTDIALLKIDAQDELPAIQFGDSDASQVGEWVLAVGNPFNLTSTVTAGIISAKSRDLSGDQSFIQTDAAVNPGNSGGALVNMNGELIGINTAITSQTGSYIGYSFAVPSNIARKIVEDLIEFGDVQTGILGVSILNPDSEEGVELGINEIQGVYISDITKNSGAAAAGLKEGDVITRLDNIEITKFSDLSGYLKTKRPNDVVNVEIERENELRIVPVTLSNTSIGKVEFMNMTFTDISKIDKQRYGIESGVIIQRSNNRLWINRLGIQENYVITKINDFEINSIEDINTLKQRYGDEFEERIERISFIDGYLRARELVLR
ncbi:S1C family serine protease [Winogradskyella aurantiaca]|uniref:S1C family serine protease n=1 Tax=Winogradskyella aurantiaca TaxID=2219558 RepID=UPI000E1DC23A|nr:trypsin-like peptidase domain-containing protein [Winogradskyella aurantiaca]